MSIQKKFKEMINMGVQRKSKRRNIPPNRRLIDSWWLFKKKIDGRFRARLVGCGYTQVPGIDFTENYSPVVTDVTLHIMLLMWLIKKWDSHTIDVETAFLYAVLEEEIYMKIPEVMAEILEEYYKYKDILTLITSIYGLVKTSRCCFKEYIKTTTLKVGFKQCKTDPWILYRVNELGTVTVTV